MLTRSLPSDRGTPLHYVALGDSTAYGLGASSPSRHFVARLLAHLRIEYPAARLTNQGACAATVADVLAGQLPATIVADPHLVTLSVGPNDLRQGHPARDFAGRLEVLLERLAHETGAMVVLNSLPDLGFCPRFAEAERSLVMALTTQYNHALRDVAGRLGVEVVDLGLAGRPEAERRRFFCDDGYHPSDDGYAAWADAMWATIRRKIPDRRSVAAPRSA